MTLVSTLIAFGETDPLLEGNAAAFVIGARQRCFRPASSSCAGHLQGALPSNIVSPAAAPTHRLALLIKHTVAASFTQRCIHDATWSYFRTTLPSAFICVACHRMLASHHAPSTNSRPRLALVDLHASGCRHFRSDLLCLLWSHIVFHHADLVHDNLALHPLSNHLADAAVAQLLIGGAAGELAFISNDCSLRQRSVTRRRDTKFRSAKSSDHSLLDDESQHQATHPYSRLSLPSTRNHLAWSPCIHYLPFLQLWTGLWRRCCRAIIALLFFFLERNRPPCWRVCELVFDPALHASTAPSRQSSQIRSSAPASLHMLYRCQLQQRVPHQRGEPGCHWRGPGRSRLWAKRCRCCRQRIHVARQLV